ncbi:MAG: cell division protein FtsA [Bacilli bacterium]
MKKIISCLDCGSSNIKLVVCEIFNDKLYVLATSCIKSKGIKKGIIENKEQAIIPIREAFEKCEKVIGQPIKKVICIVPSSHADFIISEGTTTLNSDNSYVCGDDILKSFQACVYNKVRSNMEFVSICPLEFIIDDKKIVNDPKAMPAKKLSVKAVVSLIPKNNLSNLFVILEELNKEVNDICFSGLADYFEYSSKVNNGYSAVINIGGETTDISILSGNVLIASSVIFQGGSSVNRDICYAYDISLKESSYIKERFGHAVLSGVSTKEYIPVLTKSGENIKINQYQVSEIIYSRFKEILNESKKEINLLTKKEISYIIVTGGASETCGFDEIVKEVLGNKASLGVINEMGVRNNMFSSSLGLIKYYDYKLSFRNRVASTLSEEEQESLFTIKKKINSESIIGKIYGYFFDN